MAYNYDLNLEVDTKRHGKGGSLNMRASRSDIAQVVYIIPDCSPIHCASGSESNGWIACEYEGCRGYCMAKFIRGTEAYGTTYTYPITAKVATAKFGNGGSLSMRPSASTSGDPIVSIPNGAIIYVETLSGEWLPAEYNLNYGFVMAKFVEGSDEYNRSDSWAHPTNITEAFGTSTLGQNYVKSGNAVYNVQICLYNFVDPYLTIDSVFGPRTEQAVREFQAANGMRPVDGIVGSETKSALWDRSWFMERLMNEGKVVIS